MSDAPNPYDESPYASYPYPQSHPNRMAAIATLFGMKPQSINGCRVLELGCASGGNLLPLAVALPGSRFVGIDLSSRQVEQGQQTVSQLGLKNVELICGSILDVTPELGQFDYIICHGVWSWVPSEVREKILAVCRDQLSPQGVAYVSYNTYPGWHMRGTVRDMMVYHTRKFTSPQERTAHARALLDFLVRSVPERANAYSMLLKGEVELLRGKADSYLLHEHLEHVNEPVYFHEFEEQAVAKGLQYLGEAELGAMLTEGLGAEVDPVLGYLAKGVVEREQYLDFLRNRMFRQTLLCHNGLALNRRPDYERMRRLYFASPVLVSAPDNKPAANEETKFTGPHGVLTTADPALKAALSLMSWKWPEAIPLETLVAMVQSRIYAEPAVDASRRSRDAQSLANGLLNCYVKQFVEIYVKPPACRAVPGDHPVGSPLARLQAESISHVTNLNHQVIQLNDIGRHVLRLCDGTRSREDLLKGLVDLAKQEVIVVQDDKGTVTDPVQIETVLAESLHRSLAHLARGAVFIA